MRVGEQPLRVAIRPGTGGGPPLLLCNGIGAPLEAFEPFTGALDPAIEVVRFDVPGVGGSPVPPLPYPFPRLARLAGRMLAQLGYDRFDVLGISWGGGLAQHFALVQRRRCRRLVLVSTGTGSIMVPARPEVLIRMITPRRFLDARHLLEVAPRLYGGTARHAPEWVAAAMHAHIRVGSPRGYLYQLVAGLGWTSLPFLPLLRQATLILSGDDDPLIPLANARLLRRLIPNARLHVYDGGHLSLVTEAAQHAPVVDRFLTAADPAAIPDYPPAPRRDP